MPPLIIPMAYLSHPDDLWPILYVIQMKCDDTLSHPDDLAISSGWLVTNAVCHRVRIRCHAKTYGWLNYPTNAECHPVRIRCHAKSSGWLSYHIWMTYDQYSMSTGWHTIPPYVIRMTKLLLVSHLDELWHIHHVIRLPKLPLIGRVTVKLDKSSRWRYSSRYLIRMIKFLKYFLVMALEQFRIWETLFVVIIARGYSRVP